MSDLPPIRFANGACLVVNEVTAPSGVKRIVFGDNPEKPMARLGYREVGRKACFAGMLFKNAPDEYKAGTSILSYFFETAIPELGLNPGETSKIHKPVIALLLARYGLEADTTSEYWSRAGLLVQRVGISRKHPQLHFCEGNEEEFEDEQYQRFYDIVLNRELPFLYPLKSPSKQVDVHTSYIP